ncbi:alpha/beta hydrolase [Paenarthrobacter sp. Z7-10]|uniref:alpha/beta hydrolase n=1 Tax=Paenarthrobacter sp. Z7-10 TaxID=2787635 RepID=UPI002E765458|nr:alpha/beta hydrolase [Paenarthrobacter sp. Z7-10]
MDRAAEPLWTPDFLGPGYQQLVLDLGFDSEGPVMATLVRHLRSADVHARQWWQRASGPQGSGGAQGSVNGQAMLYLHGWADYFFQRELAEFCAEHGLAFYALDLRKYGRSLLPGQSEGFITDLEVYDEDIDAALSAVKADMARRGGSADTVSVHLLGHSLGGLIATLWAARHPGRLTSLILNGPWLELQGSRFVRQVATHLVDPFARSDPRKVLHFPEMKAYWQSVSSSAYGSWELNPLWRPAASFPLRAGWIKAVLVGHAKVGKGLTLDVPVLMLLSERTVIAADWTPEMMGVDAVIDVNEMARLGLTLGRRVMVNRYPGALHDVLLSADPVRKLIYADLADWMRAYATGS